jgi:hypothetical protein
VLLTHTHTQVHLLKIILHTIYYWASSQIERDRDKLRKSLFLKGKRVSKIVNTENRSPVTNKAVKSRGTATYQHVLDPCIFAGENRLLSFLISADKSVVFVL